MSYSRPTTLKFNQKVYMLCRILLKKKLIILTTSDHLSYNDGLVNLLKLTTCVNLNDRLLVNQIGIIQRKIYTERHKLQLVAVTAQNRPTAQKYIVFLT